MNSKICHLTSVHPRNDTRIFIKELKSLSRNGYDTHIVVADGKGDENREGIKIIDVGKSNSRISRMFTTTKKVYKKAIEINADIYQFHDPELIGIGTKLQNKGKKVIYDIHEDVPKDILSKYYIPKPLRWFIAFIVKKIENWRCRNFSYLVTATPSIKERFLKINKNCEVINNYPIIEELQNEFPWEDRKDEFCYIGAITKVRGIVELLNSLNNIEFKLNLAGKFVSDDLEEQIKSMQEWQKVNFYGYANRKMMKDILSRSKVGVVNFHPEPNHIDAQPNKMFEYMSAGIPIVTSDFPLWKEIVEGNDCGICVNPLNHVEIANAVNSLIKNDSIAKQKGLNGLKAVKLKYNWNAEEKKLLEIYNILS